MDLFTFIDGMLPGAFQLVAFVTFGLVAIHLLIGKASTVVIGFLSGLASTWIHQLVSSEEGMSAGLAVAVLLIIPVSIKIWFGLQGMKAQRRVEQTRADAIRSAAGRVY